MANVTAFQRIDLPADLLWVKSGFTLDSVPTATQISITDGFHTQIFNGTGFTFDLLTQTVTGGTVTSSDYLKSDVLVYTADNLSLPIANLLQAISLLYFGNDVVNGSPDNDRITGFAGNDTIYGNDGVDSLIGAVGNDVLFGGNGRDVLFGAAGADILEGGLGRDRLSGGFAADTFVFTSLADSGITFASRDNVVDFISGTDKLDLSALDGDTTTPALFNEVAAFTTAPTGEGEWMFNSITHILSINTDTDLQAEFSVLLTGVTSLQATDLIL